MTNIDKLEKIFPECITETEDAEGNLIRAVDFERLKQILSDELLDGREAYVFNFVGKRRAELEAHKKIKATLRPIIEQSRDFDTTKNLYIEGDNLDALKILQESYLGKVKMIYIDPPYNTGNDFIYRDDFKQDADDFDTAAKVINDEGNRLLNREGRGRFHSDWCAMIYSRLLIAKNFLSDDGVIFISIDDHEQANLKKICDEVFGEKNFVAQLIWKSKSGGANDSRYFAIDHEYILAYTKDAEKLRLNLDKSAETTTSYNRKDEHGEYSLERLDKQSLGYQASLDFPIIGTDGKTYVVEHKHPNAKVARWRWSKETVAQRYDELVFNYPYVYTKNYKKVGAVPRSLLIEERFGRTRTGKTDFFELFNGEYFSNPKPFKLIKFLIQIATGADSIVMDFFSGSATTAHAVMELNAQDGGKRQFIMIQIPEKTPDNSEARRAGYETICDIGKERIRRAGDKLKEKYPALDVGFRVFKVDSSNFKDLPKVWTPQTILDFAENIKDDRDEWDLLFGALLDTGKPIDLPIASEELDGVKVLTCAGGEILASFDKNIPAAVFRKLARRKPQKIFFRDASFASSADKINALEFFRTFAQNTTTVKVL